ncbi:MAG: peptidylprolyl isomerase [Kiritimatiellae bacterium]|nr:peptidylprolyl isomerase [Kiritimatiellia bacterium]
MQKITVNGEPVSQEMIQFNVQRLIRFHASHGMAEDQIRAQLPELVKSATEQAIGEILLMGEAQKLQFPIPESEIDEQIEEITEQLGGQEKFDRALAERKTSLADFREQLKRGKRVEKLIAKITETAADPTEAEIEAHFKAHRGEYVKGEQVLAQHILITPDGETQTSKDQARAKIEAIRARIVDGGADFSDEAQIHSMCPSASEGGSLGWFSRGMMVPEFDKVAFEMKDGEVSDIVETQFGYHIIKKMDHKEESEPSFDEVREQIRDFLRHERRGEIMTAYVEELKAKAKIVRE